MNRQKTKKRYKLFLAVLCMVFSLCQFSATNLVHAASGSVYSCKVTPTYQHPVTGKIEDSGGAASKATGQGMVEGSVYSKGLLEQTDSGEYYLTFRMSLIDYTSKHSFSVQTRGSSSWTSQSVVQTATGKDNNGKTADLRIKIPSKDSIVRCSMFVKPMGRSVIFYFYPGNYTSGNTVGMKAKMVTASSSGTQTSDSQTSAGQTQQSSVQSTQTAETTTTSQQTTTAQTGDDSLNNAQGLSLSTAPKSTKKKNQNSSEKSVGTWILILTVSMTLSGLILLGVAAAIVYYYRRNWDKWGGDKDEYDEIYNDEN